MKTNQAKSSSLFVKTLERKERRKLLRLVQNFGKLKIEILRIQGDKIK